MPGPLNGLKILDFTTLLPGPYATMMLADMGAEVLRILSGSYPDMASFLPPFLPCSDLSCNLAYLGRGKRCLNLNLKMTSAVEIVHRLIKKYDIVIEQFRPGVMAKLGLGYEDLKSVNPSLIYCSLTGYGQTGPLKSKAGHDINYLARSGLMDYSGTKDKGPSLTGMQIADVASGSNNSVIGILAAVIHRKDTGKGQHIDISMTDGVMAFNAMTAATYLAGAAEPQREQEFLNGGSLYDFYETKDGRYISFGGLEAQFFAAFCRVIGREDLLPYGIITPDLEKVKKEIREIFLQKTRDQWTEIFSQVDACVEPVLSLAEAIADENTLAREMVVEFSLPSGEKLKQIANPIKFSATKLEYRFMGCPAGTHSREVLLEIGYTEEQIRDYEKEGILN
ncbi:MAG: CaiB/BaiF CoA-transferase family protein [Deltaproteobacteria bacterium]|nr:CaiB/BaiF CoA-transferase family protein [Deltaproteobacteria bacterium]